jgi:acetyl esterase
VSDTTPYVRPDVKMLLDMLAAMGGPKMNELPLADARASYVQMAALVEADPVPLATIKDLSCPGPRGDIPLRLYDARAERAPGPVVMFYHGGGFVIGDLDSHHALCTTIAAELDLPVVAVHYALAPEHPFPASDEDSIAATRWVAENGAALGREATGLVTMGDSAGGHLAIVVAQDLAKTPARVPVILQVPIYPATDESSDGSMAEFAEGFLLTKETMDWFMDCYAPVPGDPRAYPIHGDQAGSPPTLLVTASLDPLRDQGRRYAAALAAAGVECHFMEMKGSIHGFVNLRKAVPSAQADMLAILAQAKLMLDRICA